MQDRHCSLGQMTPLDMFLVLLIVTIQCELPCKILCFAGAGIISPPYFTWWFWLLYLNCGWIPNCYCIRHCFNRGNLNVFMRLCLYGWWLAFGMFNWMFETCLINPLYFVLFWVFCSYICLFFSLLAIRMRWRPISMMTFELTNDTNLLIMIKKHTLVVEECKMWFLQLY